MVSISQRPLSASKQYDCVDDFISNLNEDLRVSCPSEELGFSTLFRLRFKGKEVVAGPLRGLERLKLLIAMRLVESHFQPQDVMPWNTCSVRCTLVQTGLTQLLESQHSSGIDLIEAGDELVKNLKVAMAREGDQRHQQGDGVRHNHEQGVTQCLTRCLVAISRLSARREAQPTGGAEKGGRAGVAGSGVSAMLLSMNRGLLFPALSHEITCFLNRVNTDPREVVRVVCPLASALLLQPECESALRKT